MHSNTFDKISFFSLFLVIVFLPVFFLPFTNIPVEISKGLLLVAGLAIAVVSWAVARFFDGHIILPKSLCLLAGGGVVLAFLLSALFSGASKISFFGTMFDISTFWFIFAGFLLMSMSSIVFRNHKNFEPLLLGIIFSCGLVSVFQILHLFMPGFLSLGVLSDKTSNILGSWNELGLFAGFGSIASLLVIEFFPTTRALKWILQALILLEILLVAIVNFPLVWMLVGVSSLIIFVYKISVVENKKEDENKVSNNRFSVFAFIIMMISLLFFTSGQFIGGYLPNKLGLSNTEISPSFNATMLVTKGVLTKDPVFGSGPNKFGNAWALYKPAVINSTQFWETPFNSGSGLIPTLTATTGGLGILAWLVFLLLFLMSGAKFIFFSIKNHTNSEIMALFILSLYLFVSTFLYSVGAVIFLLALALLGVFIGISTSNDKDKEISIPFLNDPRKSFLFILLLIILIVISAALSFKYVERLISVSYFNKALSATSIEDAEVSIARAISLNSNDLYLRAYSQIYMAKLNSLVAKGEAITKEEKAQLQPSFDQAINGAQLATTYNSQNYLNFQLLGSVYQTVGSLGVQDVYVKAIEAYKTASTLNPLNPGLKFALASVSFADKKLEDAKTYATEALSLKPDYVDALVILSQIAKSEGDNEKAISLAEKALLLAPENKDLIEYVESLREPNASVSADTSKTDSTTSTKSEESKKSQ